MWRVVVARSDENSTLLSSEITSGGVGTGHISTLSGPAPSHHWGYPPPPHHPPYQTGPQHPDMRHHHDMRGPDLRHTGSGAIVELRHDMQRTDLRVHQADMQRPEVRHPEMQRTEVRHPEMHRNEMTTRQQQQQQQQQHPELGHQDISGMRPDLTELRPSHELPELKIDGAELRTRESQQQQQVQSHQQRNLKRAMSDSDCDDVFSEESGKEP